MPFFFIVPVWFLCVVVGLVLCLFKQSRFLSTYLILSSTGSTITSLALSTLLLWVAPKLLGPERTLVRLFLIAAYLASIAFGGLIGMIGGFVAARKINQRLGWTQAP
jgi:ABC-type antimicrobial peptide transport system permease subunit